MIETPLFTFSSAPKTGCQWMAEVCRKVYPNQHTNDGCLHHGRRVEGKPAISFVRDPADWLRSYYQNIDRMIGNSEVDCFTVCRRGESDRLYGTSTGLEMFIARYTSWMPQNSIYRMFLSFPADQRWRIEDMPLPLELLVGTPLRGIEQYATPSRIEITSDVREAVYRHEPLLCREFKYGKGAG